MRLMTALILHGIGGHAGIHWQGWLGDQLVKRGWRVIMPQLPEANHPDRREWLKTVSAAVSGVGLSELVVVGHSLGVPTALDFIERAKEPVKGLVSVAGFAQDYGAALNSYFMREREIDFAGVNGSLQRAVVFYGDDDPYVPQSVLLSLAENLGVEPQVFSGGGHLNSQAGFKTFPELLEAVCRMDVRGS